MPMDRFMADESRNMMLDEVLNKIKSRRRYNNYC